MAPSLFQLNIWNRPQHINLWLLHPLICHNYFISNWSDCGFRRWPTPIPNADQREAVLIGAFSTLIVLSVVNQYRSSPWVSVSKLSWQVPCFILRCVTLELTVNMHSSIQLCHVLKIADLQDCTATRCVVGNFCPTIKYESGSTCSGSPLAGCQTGPKTKYRIVCWWV